MVYCFLFFIESQSIVLIQIAYNILLLRKSNCADTVFIDVYCYAISDKNTNTSCSVENGGCSQNCTTISDSSYVCHCNKGYNISTENRKDCIGKIFLAKFLLKSSECVSYMKSLWISDLLNIFVKRLKCIKQREH